MDPDTALDAIRNAATDYEAAETVDEENDAATRLIEHVRALDDWLCSRGFLPRDWSRP